MSSGKGSIHLEIPFDIGHASSLHKAGCLSVDIGLQLAQRSGYSAERNNILPPNPQDLVNGLAGFKENT
jgi:hypothetical protein